MINHISFQGRFVETPELKHTSSDVPYSRFSLAWSEKYWDNESTCFLNCVAYRNIAEFIFKYFKKGDMVLVEGRLLTRNYKDQNGNKKSMTDLIVDKAHFCGSNSKKKEDLSENFDDSDLPF